MSITKYAGSFPADPWTRLRPVHAYRCGSCGQTGHNKQTCPGPAPMASPFATPDAGPAAAAVEAHRDRPDLPEPVSREQRRSRRKRVVRAVTVSMKRMTKRELELGRLLYPAEDNLEERPVTRGECAEGQRPCPFVSCKHHLYLDVSARTGAIKLNFPDLEVWEMTETCALDVADRGGETLEKVGELANLTRERIRQVEVRALARIGPALAASQDMAGPPEPGPGRRYLPMLDEPVRTDMLDVVDLFDVGNQLPYREGALPP